MHKFLKKKLSWYRQWHETWIHGPSHWVVFACAVATASALITYVAQTDGAPALVPLAQAQVAGTTYYVDGENGNDANNGLSQPAAWKTLAKASTVYQGGDTLNIHPGEYREVLTIKNGPSAARPTVINGVGSREQVKILGSEPVTGWSQYNANVWVADFSSTVTRCERMDGTSVYNKPNVTPDCWSDRSDWFTRASYANGSFSSVRENPASVNAPGEYYYDSVARKIYLWPFGSDNPNAHTIECSARRPLSLYPMNFTLQNVTIMHSSLNPLSLGDGNASIRNNDFGYNSGEGSCSENPASIFSGRQNFLKPGISIVGNKIHDQGSDKGPSLITHGGHRGSGIVLYSVRDTLIEGNEFYNHEIGVFIKAGNTEPNYTNVTIRDNIVHDVQNGIGFGLQTYASSTAYAGIIEGNLVYDMHYSSALNLDYFAIWTARANGTVRVRHNTVYNTAGVYIAKDEPATDANEVRGNIIAQSMPYQDGAAHLRMENNSAANTLSDYNLFHDSRQYFGETDTTGRWVAPSPSFYNTFASWKSGTGKDQHSIEANPLFVSAAARDFRLQAGSPAIDAGAFIAGYHCAQSDDVDSNQSNCRHWRGAAPDLGALEYGVVSSDTTAPARVINLYAQ